MNDGDDLSYEEAKRLVESEFWEFENALSLEIERALKESKEDFQFFWVGSEYGINELQPQHAQGLRNNLLSALSEQDASTKEYIFPPTQRDIRRGHMAEFRIGRGKIIRLGPTLKAGLVPLVAIASSVTLACTASETMSVAPLLGFTAVLGGGLYRQIWDAVLGVYVKLEDPKEIALFEILCHRQAHFAPQVVNFDAERDADYEKAVSKIWPTKEELANAISNIKDRRHVNWARDSREIKPVEWRGDQNKWFSDFESVLGKLLLKQVIRETNGRYRPVF